MEEELNLKNQDDFLNDGDELTLDDLQTTSKFLSNPKVGESISFTIKKIAKLEGANCIVKKKDGGSFTKALSGVDYTFEITTTDEETFTVSSWEVWGKVKAILQKLNKIKGVELRIKHIKDGMKNRDGDNYSVTTPINGEMKALDRESKTWV